MFPDREYTFKHALTRDVAYGSLLQERRRELHARIVEAIETTLSDRTGEHIEQLAHHAFRGELREKAVSYLRQAALKSAERSASRDAKAWFEQALDVLHTLPESDANLKLAFDIRLELRPILLNLGEARDMLRRVQEAEMIGDRLSDDRLRARVNSFLASIHSLLGNLDEALEAGNRAVEIAGRLGDWRLQVLAKTYLGQAHCVRGDYEQAAKWFSDNLAALPAESMHERLEITVSASVYNRYWLILSLAHLGRFAEAMVHETEAIRHAYPTRHPMTVGLADLGAATLHLLRGDWVKARPWFEHCIAALRTGNVAALLPYGISTSSLVLAQLGETPAARDRMQEGEPLLRRQAETGYLSQCAWSYHILGRTCLLLGHDDEAKLFADRAIETSLRLPGFAAYAIHLLGDIASRSDHLDASAEAHFHRALALAEQRSMRPLIAHCHLGLGKLFQRTGKREQAGEHLTTATRLYREMDMVFWLEQAEAETRLLT